MPRQPRLIVAELPVHIVQRANNRSPCFGDDGDYRVYLSLVLEASQKFACAIHAYCLMTNHVHLLMTPSVSTACGQLMHRLAQRYAYYFNRKYQRTGTLWEGRFRSFVVESARYVLACYRYIELNPVRAGMVERPGTYDWSSHSANTGLRADPLVRPHAEFLALAPTAYEGLLAESIDAMFLGEIREATNGGYPLGGDAFKSTLSNSSGRKTTRGRPGPKARPAEEKANSEPVPDLFSGGGVS